MSVVVASGEAISNNILNHSVSKQMYSFPKAPRFRELKKSSSSTWFYNIPNMMSTRKTFIGYGEKFDFTKTKRYNVQLYDVSRVNDSLHPTSPKYSFGLGRDFYKKAVISKENLTPDKVSPGPAKYNFSTKFGEEAPKYTMRKRYPLKMLQGKKGSPGPARYNNNININPEGRYTLSKFLNSPRAGWSLSKSKRFDYNCKFFIFILVPQTPGPNAYHLEKIIAKKGPIFNSRYRSADSKTISMKFKPLTSGTCTPGPGSYQTFSEFGIYRAKNADEFDRKIAAKTFYKMNRSKSTAMLSSKKSSRVHSAEKKKSV